MGGGAHQDETQRLTEGSTDCCSAPASAEGRGLGRKLHPLAGRRAVPAGASRLRAATPPLSELKATSYREIEIIAN